MTRRGRKSSMAGFCVVLFALAGYPDSRETTARETALEPGSGLRIEHAVHRFLTPLDKGRTRVFLRNDSSSPVVITRILLNDTPLPTCYVWPEIGDLDLPPESLDDDRVLWARILVNPIPPGGQSEIFLQWAYRPRWPIKVVVETENGQRLEKRIAPSTPAPIRLMAMRFGSDRRTIGLYVKNTGEEATRLRRVLINTRETTTQTLAGSGTSMPQARGKREDLRRMGAGRTKCLVVRCERPLRPGELVFAKAVTDNGTAQGWARVHADFTTGTEASESCLFADYSPRLRTDIGPAAKKPPFIRTAYCVTHRPPDTSVRQRARLALAADYRAREAFPGIPTLINLCKQRQEEGLLTYGAIGDHVLTNANEPERPPARHTADGLETATQRLSELATEACAPRPWSLIVMLDADDRFPDFHHRRPTGAEIRARIYWAISRGCQGLCYRGLDGQLPADTLQFLRDVEAEIGQIRDRLILSFPVGRGLCDDPEVEGCVLQAGFDALILLVINHDIPHRAEDMGPVAEWRAKQDVTVRFAAPASVAVGDAFWIRGRRKIPLPCRSRNGEVVVSLPRLGQAEIVLLEPSREP